MRTVDILKNLKDDSVTYDCDPKWHVKFEEFLNIQKYKFERITEDGRLMYRISGLSAEDKELIEDWFDMSEQYPLNDSVLEETRVAAIAVVKSWGANDIQDYGLTIVTTVRDNVETIEVRSSFLDFDAMDTLCKVLSDVVGHYGYSNFEPEQCSLWRAKKYEQ